MKQQRRHDDHDPTPEGTFLAGLIIVASMLAVMADWF